MLQGYKQFIIVFLSVITVSCSSVYEKQDIIINRDTDYLNAKSIPPLKIPPGLSSSTIKAHYPVSEKNYPEDAKKVNLIPPGLNTTGN